MAEIPVLKIGDCLLVSIQVDMHDRLALALQDDLTSRIVADRARGVMIDISALEIVNSFIGRMLNNIAAMSRVLDAVTVVVGMRPAVAITLVELGLSLTGVRTALNVDKGLELIRQAIDEQGRGWSSRNLTPWRCAPPGRRSRAQTVRANAIGVGFGIVDQTKLVTAASEVARNTVDYGGGGTMLIDILRDGLRRGVQLTFSDRGPGIADLKMAMTDGYTTGGGLGLGLSGAKRLSNEFSIESARAKGRPSRSRVGNFSMSVIGSVADPARSPKSAGRDWSGARSASPRMSSHASPSSPPRSPPIS